MEIEFLSIPEIHSKQNFAGELVFAPNHRGEVAPWEQILGSNNWEGLEERESRTLDLEWEV